MTFHAGVLQQIAPAERAGMADLAGQLDLMVPVGRAADQEQRAVAAEQDPGEKPDKPVTAGIQQARCWSSAETRRPLEVVDGENVGAEQRGSGQTGEDVSQSDSLRAWRRRFG